MSILKSLRDRLVGALSKGDVPADPDEVVEAGTVGHLQGPMIVARLADAGIRATAVDQRLGGNQIPSRTRVMVVRRDAERAAAVIDEFIRDSPSRDAAY